MRRAATWATAGLATACLAGAVAAPARAAGPLGVAGPPVRIGPGAVESSIRQVVRTLAGRVYVVAVDDNGRSGPTHVRMYRAVNRGVPTAFAEVDAGHGLRARGGIFSGPTIAGGDARLDRHGAIHVALFDTADGHVIHQVFDTRSDRWRAPQTVARYRELADDPRGSDPASSWSGIRGAVNTAIAVEPGGGVTVIGCRRGRIVAYRRHGRGWRATTIERSRAENTLHPSIVADRHGRLDLAWLDLARSGPRIRFARRSTHGRWSRPVTVPARSVLGNSTLDQSPSLVVDRRDRPVALFLDADDHVRVEARTASGRWRDVGPRSAVFAHTPGLYARGDSLFALLGHDEAIHPGYLTRAAGASRWSSFRAFETSSQDDGSASARFDPTFETDCTIVDAVFFDEDPGDESFRPTAYYEPIRLAGARSGHGGCRSIAR